MYCQIFVVILLKGGLFIHAIIPLTLTMKIVDFTKYLYSTSFLKKVKTFTTTTDIEQTLIGNSQFSPQLSRVRKNDCFHCKIYTIKFTVWESSKTSIFTSLKQTHGRKSLKETLKDIFNRLIHCVCIISWVIFTNKYYLSSSQSQDSSRTQPPPVFPYSPDIHLSQGISP